MDSTSAMTLVDSTIVLIQNTAPAVVDTTVIAITPEQGKIIADWIVFMQDTPSRLLVEGSIGAIFALLAYAISRFIGHFQIGPRPMALLATISMGLGAVIAFFISHVIPGLDRAELVIAMIGGGGSSYFINKGDQSMKAVAVHRRVANGHNPEPNEVKPAPGPSPSDE